LLTHSIGTLSLLRLAHSGAPKTFAFTSSSAACALSPSNSSTSAAGGYNTGYALSKYLTESLLSSFSQHLHLPIRILRLGQLCGHSATGIWNATELWPILFKSSIALNTLPVFDPVLTLGTVDWLPVDVAAKVVEEVLLRNVESDTEDQDEPEYREYNIVNPSPIPWKQMLSLLQQQLSSPHATEPESMGELKLADWVALLNEADDEGLSAEDIPALKLLPFFERMVGESPSDKQDNDSEVEVKGLDTSATWALSPTLRSCERFSEAWIERSVQWWLEIGFFA
jgi:thioester reductase-like protein